MPAVAPARAPAAAPPGPARPGVALAGAVACGAGLAAQSRLNGQLGVDLHAPLLAALVSFGGGFLAVALLVAVRAPSRQALARVGAIPRWTWSCGVIGALLITVSAAATPVVGVAVLTVGLVAGSTTGGLLADRAGLGPGGVVAVTPARVAGAALCLLAVGLSAAGRTTGPVPPLLVLLLLGTGLVITVQSAGSGWVRRVTGDAAVTALLNFGVGTLALAVVVLARPGSGPAAPARWPGPGHGWLYAGGLLGIAFVMVTAQLVHRLGVLRLGLAVVAGQLLGAVALDELVPARPGGVSLPTLLAAGLTLVAALLTGVRRRG